MKNSALASKKNVIVLSAVALAIVLMVGSYYAKQSRIKKMTALGGHIELVSEQEPFSPSVNAFINARSPKWALVVDLKTTLSLPSGPFESNVRMIGDRYPLIMPPPGHPWVHNKLGLIFISKPKQKLFGAAANQAFLDKTGVKIGDVLKMKDVSYQVRGTFDSLPDDSGKSMAAEPLLVIKYYVEPGSGIMEAASKRTYHFFILENRLSTANWEKLFKAKLPNMPVTVRRWDE